MAYIKGFQRIVTEKCTLGTTFRKKYTLKKNLVIEQCTSIKIVSIRGNSAFFLLLSEDNVLPEILSVYSYNAFLELYHQQLQNKMHSCD